MAGEEEMEDDDDDDVDFNPYLQRSPSAERESGDSSKRVGESEDGEEEGMVEGQEDGNLPPDSVQQMFRGSEQFVGEFDGDEKFFEFASDDYEEEEFEDVEQEEMLRDYSFDGGSKGSKYSTKNVFKGKDREYLEGCLNGIDYGETTCSGEDMTADQNLEGLRNPLNGEDCSISSGNIVYGTQDKPENDAVGSFPGIGTLAAEDLRSDREREAMVDAISKRTRAHYSLTDMSLDQLETFLQESDEDEYFQTVDDEEEYRKFLLAVQEIEDPTNEKPAQISRKEDEDDEDEDVDFEIEIEEALESDDTSESLRKRRRRRPETREKRRQRAQFQTKGTLLGQAVAPLRHLLPHVGNLADDFSIMDRRKAMAETGHVAWSPNAKGNAPVNGFTAHQIGQLYCLIHEHVQLLVQVYSLCILEPARQQMAMDTHRMLMELVEKRELLLSWKKTAFPDFCFRPPYTHPSLVEGIDEATFFHALPPDISRSTSTSGGQSTRLSSNDYPGSYFTQGSVSDLGPSSTTCSHNLGQITAELPQSYSLPRILEPASRAAQHFAIPEHFSQQTAGTSQSLQETAHPFSTWTPSPEQRPRSQSASEGVSASHTGTLPGASFCGLTGPFVVDPTSVFTNPLQSADDLLQPHSHCSGGDPTSVTENYFHPSVTSSGKAPVGVILHNYDNPETLPPAMVQTATSSGGVQILKSRAGVLGGQVRCEWAPETSGPVRSLLDVAPLALVRDFLTDVSHVVQEYRQRHVESGAYHTKCEREPLFVILANNEQDQNAARNLIEGTRQWLFGGGEACTACVPRPQIKKTMAAALVESTKKQSLALVPKDAAMAVQRFLPYFNKAFFPHKPPPVATANRLLFTDAEDELLAMGLMMYNTDWKAIQQRFLPSKSMHQIFVRQKNRSSARAPENSIKAVRRMKSSPLTHSERSSIQEGLGMFKYDWNKVWQYCVPHRDPAVLPRQWRIAVGTQKSYKTSETSKERRRLYEANRRQRIAAKKTNDTASTMEEDAHLSCTGTSLEGSKCKTGNKDAEDPDNAYIREAFLDDWCPRSTPVATTSAAPVPSPEKQRKLISSLSKKKKAKVEVEAHLSSSSPWLDSQTGKTNCLSRKQTVKLAPGLPSVKLPPFVQVLSQSQVQPPQHFSLGTRLPPVTSQWVQMTSQGLDKLELSVQATQGRSSSLSICATESTIMHVGGSTSQHSPLPFSTSVYKRGQTLSKKAPPAPRVPNEQMRLMMHGPTQVLDKKSRLAHLRPMEGNLRKSLLFQPIGDSIFANDLSSQNHLLRDSVPPLSQPGSVQGFPPFCGESTGSELPSIQRPDSLPVQSMEIANIISSDQLGSDSQDPTSLLMPPESVHCLVSRPFAAATTSVATDAGGETQLSGIQSPVQASPSTGWIAAAPADSLLNAKGIPPCEATIAETELQTNSTQRQVSKKSARERIGQGGFKAKRNPTKRNKKLVHDNHIETRNGDQGVPSSASMEMGSQQVQPILVAEGALPALSTSSRRYRGRNTGRSTGRSRSKKGQKVQEACVENGSQEPSLEQHVIVMEQEELSDSEDEADAGVEFEHEEMGDSDKDAEVELRNVKQSRATKLK